MQPLMLYIVSLAQFLDIGTDRSLPFFDLSWIVVDRDHGTRSRSLSLSHANTRDHFYFFFG